MRRGWGCGSGEGRRVPRRAGGRFGSSPGVKVRLESDEGVADAGRAAEFGGGVGDGAVFQLEKLRQLGAIEFAHAFLDVLEQDEIEEGLKLGVVMGEDVGLVGVGALLPGDRR